MKIDQPTMTLLRGLLLPDLAARSHLEKWCRNTDLDEVDVATHRLLPQLYRRLADLGMSPPEINRLRGVYRKTWYRNQRHLEAVKRAATALADSGIELTLFGGLSLALGTYAELGMRMVDAAQVAVKPDAIAPSIDRLTKAGFAVDGRVALHGFGLPTRLRYQGGAQIDLREFVYGPGWPGTMDEQLQQRGRILEFDGMPIGTLAPSDAVAVTAARGLSIPPLRYECLVDLAMLTRQTDPAVNWTDLIDDYRDTVLSVPIAEAFRVLTDEIREVLPAEAQDATREMRPTRRQHMQFWLHRRGRRLGRLPNWYRRANKPVHDDRPVSFAHFTKSVYNVDTARDAWVKALRKLRPV